MARPSRTLLLVVVGALATVLVAEVGARALAPRLPAPDPWGDDARAVKVAQLDHLAADGCVDVVVAGDSMARDAVDPAAFAAADPTGRRLYNASLDAAGPELLAPWLTDQVLPRVDPATVVVAISSIDLNEASAGPAAALASYRTSAGGRDDALGAVQRWASARSALVANRVALRQPAEVWSALWGVEDEESTGPGATDAEGRPVLPGVLGPGGEGLSRRDLRHRGPSAASRFTAEQLLAGYDPGEDPAGRIAALVDALRARDVEVVLVVLPVTDDFADLHPGGRADLDRAHDAVTVAAEQTGTPLVDLLDEPWPVEHFADTHHLNGLGQAELSDRLPALLRQAGVPETACSTT